MEISGFGSFDYTKIDINVKTRNNQNLQDPSTQNEQTKEQKSQKSFEELSPSEKQLVSELQARDTEVRAHEAAHQSAGAGLAGGASFSYQKGPDGKMYAIGGEVPISFKEGKDPQETIANARQVKAAAMAPANPSPQDYAVANTATMMELKAQQLLQKEQRDQQNGIQTYQHNSLNN
ncbi:MAG: hypothetical protein GXO11_05045 [Epsilonproteobacteria bacterium]|nr:hypothetical protein [Campylobacterota bacterium]